MKSLLFSVRQRGRGKLSFPLLFLASHCLLLCLFHYLPSLLAYLLMQLPPPLHQLRCVLPLMLLSRQLRWQNLTYHMSLLQIQQTSPSGRGRGSGLVPHIQIFPVMRCRLCFSTLWPLALLLYTPFRHPYPIC